MKSTLYSYSVNYLTDDFLNPEISELEVTFSSSVPYLHFL
jgi:hypothetical protein